MIVLILFPFFLTFTNDIHTQCNICLKYLHFCQFLNISIGCHNKLSWCVQTFLLHCITFYYAQREISWRPGKTSKFRPIHSTIQIWTYFFLLHSHENKSKFVWQNGMDVMLTFSVVSRKFLAMRNITLHSVHTIFPGILSKSRAL